ncbi:MAG TPA: hypothetical protein RMH85_29040 [Polyangiaceae bacterium LLY-WYZ-15_(1-7)]|nr:hypothetical protein [Myxococcales bacterium]MAT24402.1 hypothetical protein [Sandaracinus sp.]HJK93127.1 hypothetical protein [Polyangiaceae bacterium LLY-WYZ-15_(1-7)]MBJ70321.1 hypothetical protein [Sandaracinus sp.]HJL04901.1 hypothetical protein [Polyangiaceae bacterium LLY-WYZ-15_(1-7)]
MSGAPRVALAGLLLVACGGPEYDLARVPERTEVLLLASVHGRHLDEDLDYPSEELAALLRAAEPDVIVAELPPAGEARVRAALAAGEADPWLEAFPELREVVFPVAAELEVPVVAGSGWRRAVTEARRAYAAEEPAGPGDPRYRRAAAHLARRDAEEDLDPEWMHAAARWRLVAWRDRLLERFAGEALGPAAPSRRHAEHAKRLRELVRAHAGERLVVVFDADDLWALAEALRAMEGVTLLDARGLL